MVLNSMVEKLASPAAKAVTIPTLPTGQPVLSRRPNWLSDRQRPWAVWWPSPNPLRPTQSRSRQSVSAINSTTSHIIFKIKTDLRFYIDPVRHNIKVYWVYMLVFFLFFGYFLTPVFPQWESSTLGCGGFYTPTLQWWFFVLCPAWGCGCQAPRCGSSLPLILWWCSLVLPCIHVIHVISFYLWCFRD